MLWYLLFFLFAKTAQVVQETQTTLKIFLGRQLDCFSRLSVGDEWIWPPNAGITKPIINSSEAIFEFFLLNVHQYNFSRNCTFPSYAGKQWLRIRRGLPHGLLCRLVPKMLQHLLVHRRLKHMPTPSTAHMDVCRHMLRVPGHILVMFLLIRAPCVVLTPSP